MALIIGAIAFAAILIGGAVTDPYIEIGHVE